MVPRSAPAMGSCGMDAHGVCREAVAKLDQELLDGHPVDVLHLHQEVVKKRKRSLSILSVSLPFGCSCGGT